MRLGAGAGAGAPTAAAFAWCPLALSLAACASDRQSADRETEVLASIGPIAVLDAYAPEPVTPDVAALYFTVRNAGSEPDRLLTVSVDVAAAVQLHDQVESGGMVQMRQLDGVSLPPGEVTSLAPGGVHGMLMNIERDYHVGDTLRVEIRLEQAGNLLFGAPVVSYAEVAEKMDSRGDSAR